MELLENLKKLGNELEEKRTAMLQEVEQAQRIYRDDVLANFKFKKQAEYSELANVYEEKKNEEIDNYITALWAAPDTKATKEDLSAYNEICRTLDNVGSFAEFELDAILDIVKDNVLIMGMLERKIEDMRVVPEGVKVYEHFKIFEPLQEKRKAIRGIDEIKKFKDDLLFSHVLQDTNFSMSWSIKMKILNEVMIYKKGLSQKGGDETVLFLFFNL